MMIANSLSAGFAAVLLVLLPMPQTSAAPQTPTPAADQELKFSSAEEAYKVGVAFTNARNFKSARGPLEAALRLTDDDAMRLKIYEALLHSYRQIPEFEPFQTATEYLITHARRDAQRSLTRRSFLSFAYNRGQVDNLIERYEARLAKKRDDFLAVYMLSELYTMQDRDPKRAIELMKQLESLEAANRPSDETASNVNSPAQAAAIVREKAKLAQQHVRAKQYREAAELYEQIAPLDPTTHAWNLKEAAAARLKAGDRENALRLALAAEKATPEARNEQLTHFFHRNLGDLLLDLERPREAIPHYEIALKTTKIAGYVEGTQASLQKAREQSGQ